MFGRTRAVLDCERPARVFAVAEGDNIGSSSSPSAASIFNKFSSRLGSESGMIVPGLVWLLVCGRSLYGGGCMGWSSSWLGRSPVVRTVLRVETGEEEDDTRLALAELEVTTRHFCLAACWAFARAAISSSCRGTGVKG